MKVTNITLNHPLSFGAGSAGRLEQSYINVGSDRVKAAEIKGGVVRITMVNDKVVCIPLSNVTSYVESLEA